MQEVLHLSGAQLHRCFLPPADAEISSGLRWGRFEQLSTPAYWAAQSWMWELEEPTHFKLGKDAREEILACVLGGYGIPAEVGLAAYARLQPKIETGEIEDEDAVRAELTKPLTVRGRQVRYRFANQKAKYVAAAFRCFDPRVLELDDRGLRDALTELPGIGSKTASWIVRNLRSSDAVAILDVHLLRTGRLLGIFPNGMVVERHYRELEELFLSFADGIRTRASILDSVIWMTVRQLPANMTGTAH